MWELERFFIFVNLVPGKLQNSSSLKKRIKEKDGKRRREKQKKKNGEKT